jgi:hypothetical protein
MNPVQNITIYPRSILILPFQLCLFPLKGLFPSRFPTEILYAILISSMRVNAPFNRTNYGFGINSNNQEMQRLNHLLYMDDIKLYAATNNQLQELLQLIQTC